MINKSEEEYLSLVEDILKNNKFNKLKEIEHHGTTRFDHSYRVSYYAYKISKRFNFNYIETARAGLLHDFFLSTSERTTKEKIKSTFNHTKKAGKNAVKEFNVSGKEYDIIVSHMFPFCTSLPKSIESWVVIFTDKVIGLMEWNVQFSRQFTTGVRYAASALLLMLFSDL